MIKIDVLDRRGRGARSGRDAFHALDMLAEVAGTDDTRALFTREFEAESIYARAWAQLLAEEAGS